MPTRQARAIYARKSALGWAVLWTYGETVCRLCWPISPIETWEHRYSGGRGSLLQVCFSIPCAESRLRWSWTVWSEVSSRRMVRLNAWSGITPGCFSVGCLGTFVSGGKWSTSLLPLIIPRLHLRSGLTVIWNPPWKFSTSSQKIWDEDLPWISIAFNTATHESTRATPDALFLGRELRCPLGVRWDLTPVYSGQAGRVDARAYQNLKLANRKVARKYNRGREPNSFGVGDTVRYRWKSATSKAREVSAKMLRWSEPTVIA